MHVEHHKSILPKAKKLRKNMTKHERKLWYLFLVHCKMKLHTLKTE